MRPTLIAAAPTLAALLACSSLTGEEVVEEVAEEPVVEEAPAAPANGTPLAPAPAAQALPTGPVTATACTFEGFEIIGSSGMSLLRSVAVVGDRLYIVDEKGAVRALTINGAGGGCKLSVDASFGQGGTWTAENEIQHLTSDASGVVVASNGIFGAYTLRDGAPAACDTKGYVELHASGAWGIAPWVNSTVQQVEVNAAGCSSKPWVLQDLSDDAKRKGIFASVDASSIIGDNVYIGGSLAKSVDADGMKVVAVYDQAGKELRRFGGSKDLSSTEMFGWVHDISACVPGVCVLDSNFRRLTAWGEDGKQVGTVDLKALLGLDYPWIADMALGADGSMWMIAANKRADAEMSEAIIYRVAGLGVLGEGAEADEAKPAAPMRPQRPPRPDMPVRPQPGARPGEVRQRPR
jgi:hypothetical protein